MSFSYNPAALANSNRDKVRLMIGDTDATRQLLQNEEIDYVLSFESSPTLAAAASCDLLASKYAFQVNTENSELKIQAAARHKHYLDLADRLRAGGAGSIPGDSSVIQATMYVGGAVLSETAARAEDTDLAEPIFSVGQDDLTSSDDGSFLYGDDL